MAIDFPTSPSVNDIHTSGGRRWTWNGTSWERSGTPGPGDTISATNDNTTSTLYPVLVTGTGSNTAKVATTASKSVSFNASNGTLTATTFSGALSGNSSSATILANARTIGGVSFDGSANINLPGVNASGNQDTSGNATTATEATNVTAVNNSTTNTAYRIPFLTAATGTAQLQTDNADGLIYNPSENKLTAINLQGTLATAAQPSVTSLGTLSSLNVTGNVSIGGVLTYEDVKNVDSVGIVTARSGVRVPDGGRESNEAHIRIGDDGDFRMYHEAGAHTTLENHSSSSDLILMTSSAARDIILKTNGNNERLTITSGGIVDVTGKLRIDIATGGTVGSGNAEGIFLRNTQETDNNAVTIFAGADDYNTAASAINFVNVDHSANYGDISFDTRGSGGYGERLRIKSTGQISAGGGGTAWGNALLSLITPSGRSTAFDASDGDTWHDMVIKNTSAATNNAVGLAFQITGNAYHKNAGVGIAAVKNGINSDYGADMVFVTRPQSDVAAERLRITSDGKFGFNTVTPYAYDTTATTLEVKGSVASAADTEVARFRGGSDADGGTAVLRLTNENDRGLVVKGGRESSASEFAEFGVSAFNGTYTRAFKITAGGKILAGTTSSRNVAGGSAKLQIEAASSEGMSLIRTSADSGGVYLSLGKTRNGSACQAGDKLGYISWNADDGTDLNHASAEIYTEVATGIGGNDVPGDLVFKTNGGTTTTTERLRITSSGNISVGSNGAAAEKFQVNGGNIAIVGGSSYKIDTHPLVAYAGFTDISGGSYAARLGSTGSSTIRSTQIYGGGGHIATFDGVNKRLGIDTTTPENKLKINVAGSNDGVVVQNTSTDKIAMFGARNGDATIQMGQWGSTASGTSLGVANANLAFIYTTTYSSTHPSALLIGNVGSCPLIFATNSTEKLRITPSGEVNIGGNYTQTAYKAQITGDLLLQKSQAAYQHPQLELYASSNTAHGGAIKFTAMYNSKYQLALIKAYGGSGSPNSSGGSLGFSTGDGTEKLQIQADGNLNFGTTNEPIIRVDTGNATNGSCLKVEIDGVEEFRFDPGKFEFKNQSNLSRGTLLGGINYYSNTNAYVDLTQWRLSDDWNHLEVFGYVNPNSAGSGQYTDPVHMYIYRGIGWANGGIKHFIYSVHVAPPARQAFQGGSGMSGNSGVSAVWCNSGSVVGNESATGSHYIRLVIPNANASYNFQKSFRILRRF